MPTIKQTIMFIDPYGNEYEITAEVTLGDKECGTKDWVYLISIDPMPELSILEECKEAIENQILKEVYER